MVVFAISTRLKNGWSDPSDKQSIFISKVELKR